METINKSAERIINYMSNTAKAQPVIKAIYRHKLGAQGIVFDGKLLYMLLRDANTGEITIVYFHGSLQPQKMSLNDSSDEMLFAIAKECPSGEIVNSLCSLISA